MDKISSFIVIAVVITLYFELFIDLSDGLIDRTHIMKEQLDLIDEGVHLRHIMIANVN